MFEFGFGELVLVFMIGLLVLGPQRLPKVAAEIGKWVGRARRTATQLRRQLEREIELADLEAQQKAAPPLPLSPPHDPSPPSPSPAESQASPPAGADTSSGGAPTASPAATRREISDAISAHSTSPEPAAIPKPEPAATPSPEPGAGAAPHAHESTDKPPTP